MKQASVSGEMDGAVEGCEVGERRSLGVDGGDEGSRRRKRCMVLETRYGHGACCNGTRLPKSS